MSRTKNFRIAFAAITILALIAAWAGVGAAYFLDAPRSVFVLAVVAAAFATEGAFWIILFLLGWSAVANRHWLLRLITRRNAGRPATQPQER
ncbi:hypothetical protein F1654_13040 [Alkalicaulis satelles]|uniref:Uncharacterized protein n=1 Tax=Alkalicaulis satelles TaxID=2609175 RepID=A0A5M6ZFH1_9PROT|nr:hypothetical protein [Alkalicaulis satelles]KAA5800981.1 hypothetical protein F1654_13040 [Alkalicaulis satelles]